MGTWDESAGGVVVLPDGRRVRGRTLRARTPNGYQRPDFGVYLGARRHEEVWESRWIRWADFRLPHSTSEAVAVLGEAYERAAFSRVEIACGGGTGRTGAAIAIVARYSGVPAEEVVEWVRANYRRRAIETPGQRRFAISTNLVR
jgi:hypothetical protein